MLLLLLLLQCTCNTLLGGCWTPETLQGCQSTCTRIIMRTSEVRKQGRVSVYDCA